MVVISIFVITMIITIWWIAREYLGNMAANLILIAIIITLVCCLNSIANEPTPQELQIYNQGMKGVGYR